MASIQKQIIEREKRGDRKMLKDWAEFLNMLDYRVKSCQHGGFKVWFPTIEKELINTKRRKKAFKKHKIICRRSLQKWGEFLEKTGLKVKFHGHGGFTVKPPDYE